MQFKSMVRRILAIICYLLGIDNLFYRLNVRAKRIITFHNVLPDRLLEGLSRVGCIDSVSQFRNIVSEINRKFEFSTDLLDPKTVTITFDDGMLNQYEIAGEILREKGISAIIFVAGNVIGATPMDTLVTDRLLVWTFFAPDSAVKQVFGKLLPREELWVKFVQPGYRADWQNRGGFFLSKLDDAYAVSDILKNLPAEWIRLRLSGVTERQLDDLRCRGWKIGWHTKSHFPLGMLDYAGKCEELSSPEAYRQVVLSYPYGDMGSIGEESLKLAEELGYPCAVSNDPDFSPARGPFFMMRMALSPNKYELHFVLSGLKYFLKYRKLLPT